MKGKCYMCGMYAELERHHIFGGANRKLSEQDGLVVNLCHYCHNEPPNGVHHNYKNMFLLRAKGQDMFEQKKIMEGHTPDEAHDLFIKRYGRNYL